MMREICVAESREAAMRLARPSLEQKYRAYVAWGQQRALPSDDDMTQAFDELLRDRFILGIPEQCADEVQRCVDETGANTSDHVTNWQEVRLLARGPLHRLGRVAARTEQQQRDRRAHGGRRVVGRGGGSPPGRRAGLPARPLVRRARRAAGGGAAARLRGDKL